MWILYTKTSDTANLIEIEEKRGKVVSLVRSNYDIEALSCTREWREKISQT